MLRVTYVYDAFITFENGSGKYLIRAKAAIFKTL